MFYSFARIVLKIYYKIVYFSTVRGLENIPKDTGMIICGNHKHFNDPLIISASIKQHPKFLTKSEIFKPGFVSWFLKRNGCVPVERGHNDIKAARTCIKTLQEGNTLILFPEGTRFCKHLSDVKPGAVMFAIKAQVPVVPVGISKLRPFCRAKLNIGKPIYYTDYYNKRVSSDEYRLLLNELMVKIFDLTDNECPYYDEVKASGKNEN